MKRFLFFVVCALMLAGCATQNVDKERIINQQHLKKFMTVIIKKSRQSVRLPTICLK